MSLCFSFEIGGKLFAVSDCGMLHGSHDRYYPKAFPKGKWIFLDEVFGGNIIIGLASTGYAEGVSILGGTPIREFCKKSVDEVAGELYSAHALDGVGGDLCRKIGHFILSELRRFSCNCDGIGFIKNKVDSTIMFSWSYDGNWVECESDHINSRVAAVGVNANIVDFLCRYWFERPVEVEEIGDVLESLCDQISCVCRNSQNISDTLCVSVIRVNNKDEVWLRSVTDVDAASYKASLYDVIGRFWRDRL